MVLSAAPAIKAIFALPINNIANLPVLISIATAVFSRESVEDVRADIF